MNRQLFRIGGAAIFAASAAMAIAATMTASPQPARADDSMSVFHKDMVGA